MPQQELERCVMALLSDPEFQPQPGMSKEESAFAVCSAQLQETSAIAGQLEKMV